MYTQRTIANVMNIHKIESFHGSVTANLVSRGLDSAKVLNAVNSWVGEQKSEMVKDDAKAKMAGKETKGGDKRVIRIDRITKTRVETALCPQGMLYAFNDEFGAVADKYNVRSEVIELPPMVETWLTNKADSFRKREKVEEAAPVA